MKYPKTCSRCEASFLAEGPAGKYCAPCQEERKVEIRAANKLNAEARRRERGCKVGRGGPSGSKHPSYKHGYYVAQTQSRKYKEMTDHTCERCGTDLSEANKWRWCVHHKDHDHSNHDWENLELLCKRCHQVEHECWKAFEGATTIPKGSTPKRAEARDTQNG